VPVSVDDETGVLRAEAGTRPPTKAFPSLARDFPNMLFLIADGKVVHASRKGDQVLGTRREESCRGCEVFQLVAVAPECLDLGQEILRRRSRGEEVPPADYALLTRDGRRIEGVLTSELIERQGRRELLGIFTDKKRQS
jgi:PAS domain-containing protein